jgi:phosphoribosylaminoimidazole-succinocarboxamide synthase
MTLLTQSTLPLPLVRCGKVREVYDAGRDRLLLVASDRVSAFDVVMNEPVAQKGTALTQLSAFWFERLQEIVPNHLITAQVDRILEELPELEEYRAQVAGRAMLVRRTEPIGFECVVRAYLAGSAWAEYRKSGTLAGEPLPQGLVQSDALPEPLFSPATKAETGHDENVTFATLVSALGTELAKRLREVSLAIFKAGQAHAEPRGIILADTKFEFGIDRNGELLLIDEVFTPDSSRFWPADEYLPGRAQPSFDKQPLRDYLDGLRTTGEWEGNPPPPPLPEAVTDATTARYLEAFRRLTGKALATP